jgi:hypothetical protein
VESGKTSDDKIPRSPSAPDAILLISTDDPALNDNKNATLCGQE